jgi:mRNA-degrading endonuclease RelE of RelBE toxin-antitoxin system
MHIEATPTFIRLYKKLPPEIKERAKKILELLETNTSYPSLGHKKMAGQTDIYEIRVSDNYRITYQRIGSTAYLRKIGTHNLLQNP